MRTLDSVQLFCILLWSLVSQAVGFVIAPPSGYFRHEVLFAEETASSDTLNAKDVLAGAEMVDFVLKPHRPMGLTIEESLADNQLVLVTKVVAGGNAAKAGLQVGDVLVEITGLFGDLINIVGVEVDKMYVMVMVCRCLLKREGLDIAH